MTRKEEFLSLIGGGKPGRVLFYPILMHFAARFNGKTYGELASDHRVLVESNIKCMQIFDFDMVSLISDPYRETSAFGAPVEFVAEGVPKCTKLIINTQEDIIALKKPDVLLSSRTLDRINGARYYKELLKEEVPVMGWVEGPLAEACDLAGVTEMLVMLMMDPDSANLLLDKCLNTAKDFAREQVAAGCDLIGVGDAICSQIDPDLYNTFVFDRHRQLVNYIHSLGAYVKFHICGNTTHLWPALSKLRLDIIDLDYLTDLDEAYDHFGPEVVRCGNINPVEIQNLSAKEVYDRSKALIAKEKGRKFMLSGGCEITVNTPAENLLAMRRACE
ncbi:MAG: uroporphyrinogen decarboxylase family protein [Bacteroidia bacterium]|nr:uroporphyrinogen decarboxylase family protein [Bacteroidia bacterium]